MIKYGGDGRLVFKLDIGSRCNNRCGLCCKDNAADRWSLSLPRAKKILSQYRLNREMLIVSGGEPTLHPALLDLIAFARKQLNYEHTQLETNARMFCYRQYTLQFMRMLKETEPILTAGIANFRSTFSFCVNIYSHDKRVHDRITQTPGSWQQAIEGIRNLLSCRQLVITNTVINAYNYQSLAHIADFLLTLGMPSQEYSFIHGDSRKLAKFYISYPAVEPYIKSLIDKARRQTQLQIFIENWPFCFLKGNEQLMSDNYYPPGKDRRLRYCPYPGLVKNTEYERIKCINRDKCRYEFICRGVDREYVNKFGWNDFKAIGLETGALRMEKNLISVLKDEKIDAIAFLSGGVDSKCATALYAASHPGKRILLLTHDNGCLFPDIRIVGKTAQDLIKHYSNIADHVYLRTPRELVREAFIDKVPYWEKNKGFNLGCHLCIMLECCVTLKMFRDSSNKSCDFIYGFRQGSNFPLVFIRYLSLFLEQYNVHFRTPVFKFRNKSDIEDSLKKFSLSDVSYQAMCLCTDIRYSDAKGDVNNLIGSDRFNDFMTSENKLKNIRVYEDPFFESFSQLLLKKFGIKKVKSC